MPKIAVRTQTQNCKAPAPPNALPSSARRLLAPPCIAHCQSFPERPTIGNASVPFASVSKNVRCNRHDHVEPLVFSVGVERPLSLLRRRKKRPEWRSSSHHVYSTLTWGHLFEDLDTLNLALRSQAVPLGHAIYNHRTSIAMETMGRRGYSAARRFVPRKGQVLVRSDLHLRMRKKPIDVPSRGEQKICSY